jgi:hypothetical protein
MAGSSGSYIVAGDTASMLLPYLRKADTTAMLAPYLKESDTVFLSNRVNLKVNIADTATMLAPYLKESDTVFLSNRINLKVNISDTSSMLTNYVRHAGYGLTKSGQAFSVDTAAMATRARVQKGIDSVAVAGLTGSGTTNYVAKFTGSSALGNSQIIDNGTAIGIDMTPPTWSALEGLHIDETSFLAGHKTSEASWVGSNAYFASGAWTRIIDGSSSMIEFGSGIISMQNASSSTANSNITFTDRFRIFSNGNIGIGTTTDAGYKLDVNGDVRFSGTLYTRPGTNTGIVMANTSAIRNTGTQYFDYGTGGTGDFYFRGGSGFANVLTLTNAGSVGIGNASPSYTTDIAGTLRSTLGANFATTSGNVGIGTASPSEKLHISRSDAGDIAMLASNSVSSNYFITRASGNAEILTTSGAIQFSTNGGEDMRISTSGELLINTTTDAGDYKLQVNGNERIAGKLDVITTTEYGVNLGRSGTSATAFQAYNSTAAMAVGIESSTGGGLFTGTSAYAAVFGNANNYPAQFVTNNTLRATISAAGELLVGTTSDQGDYNIQTNNAIYAAGNAAGVGVLVGSDKSIETTGVNLNLNANQGGAGTSTISMKLTSATPAFTFTSDAVMLFGTNTYSTMTNGLTMKNGTAPTGSATDQFHMYSADITAGNAAAHFRTENNAVIKLYQETTGVAAAAFTANSGTAVNDASTFDGYTLKQVVKALRNLGILQ